MRDLIPTLALLAAGLAPLSPAAAADPPTCQGRTATIVGNGHDRVMGTDGPDVIVSNGSSLVTGGGGSDVICLTGVTGDTIVSDDDDPLYSSAAPGDDLIVVESALRSAHLLVYLGPGDDVFRGGPEHDFVPRGYGDYPVPHGGDDVVDTGAGDDLVEVGDAPDTTPNVGTDDVRLGPGDDVLFVRSGGQEQARSWRGGTGHDTLNVGGTFVRFDVPRHRLTTDAGTFTAWGGFERYRTGGGPVTFVGSEAAETVEIGGSTRARVDLRGGDDQLKVNPRYTDRVIAHGGRGDDVLRGSRGDDRLVGGPGDDRTLGRGGDDVCRAEHRSDCGRR